MRIMIRIISGFFMVAIGIGFCLEARYLDSMFLKVLLVLLGICSLALGLYIFAKNPKKTRGYSSAQLSGNEGTNTESDPGAGENSASESLSESGPDRASP